MSYGDAQINETSLYSEASFVVCKVVVMPFIFILHFNCLCNINNLFTLNLHGWLNAQVSKHRTLESCLWVGMFPSYSCKYVCLSLLCAYT